MSQNKSLSTQEVADILHVSKSTIYDLIKKGEIHSYKIGRKVRFTQDDVDAYIARSRHEHSTRPVKNIDTHSTLLTPDKDEAPELIISVIADQYGVTQEDIISKKRSRDIALPRQIAMYLCRELTDMSLPKIGQELGGRDHTTVIHADRKIRELMAERRAIYNQVTELTNRIKQQQREA